MKCIHFYEYMQVQLNTEYWSAFWKKQIDTDNELQSLDQHLMTVGQNQIILSQNRTKLFVRSVHTRKHSVEHQCL